MTTKQEAIERIEAVESKVDGDLKAALQRAATAETERRELKDRAEKAEAASQDLQSRLDESNKKITELKAAELILNGIKQIVDNSVSTIKINGQDGRSPAQSDSGGAPRSTEKPTPTQIDIDAGETRVNITHHEDPPKKYNTDEPTGQYMYILCKDFNGGPVLTETIAEASKEYGWNEEAISKSVGALVRDKQLMGSFIPRKGTAYRVPKKVRIFVDGKEMKMKIGDAPTPA